MKKCYYIRILIACLLILLTGCGPTEEEVKQPSSDDVTLAPSPTLVPNTELTETQKEYLQREFSVTEEELASFADVLDVEVHYPHVEYFMLKEAFEKYDSFQLPEVLSNNIIKERKVDGEILYATVVENNREYLSQNPKINIYTEFSEEELRHLCNMIAKAVSSKISEIELDLNYLDATLSDLKILKSTSNFGVYASVTEETIMRLDMELLENSKEEISLEEIVTHESMHLVQIVKNGVVCGSCYKFEKLPVNPLWNTWFIEAAAECASGEINGEATLYKIERLYLDALNVATMYNNRFVDDFAFVSDLEQFYERFSCNGLVKREEIAAMMFALEIVIKGNDEFFEYYYKKNNTSISNRSALNSQFSSAAYTTLAKKFFYGLAEHAGNLEEAFSYMKLFEQLCNQNVWYTDVYRLQNTRDFIEVYALFQNHYFKMIAEKIELPEETVRELYEIYFATTEPNFPLSAKKEKWDEVYDKVTRDTRESIYRILLRIQ